MPNREELNPVLTNALSPETLEPTEPKKKQEIPVNKGLDEKRPEEEINDPDTMSNYGAQDGDLEKFGDSEDPDGIELDQNEFDEAPDTFHDMEDGRAPAQDENISDTDQAYLETMESIGAGDEARKELGLDKKDEEKVDLSNVTEEEAVTDPSVFEKAESLSGAIGGDILTGLQEAPMQALAGAGEIVEEGIVNLALDVTDFAGEQSGLYDIPDDFRLDLVDQWFDKPDSYTGGIIRGAVQFIGGYATIARKAGVHLARVAPKLAKSPKFTKIMAKSALTAAAVFDPEEKRLSDFLQQYPTLAPIFSITATNPNDSRMMGRMKNGLEDMGLGFVAEPILKMFRLIGLKRMGQKAAAKKAKGGTKETVKEGAEEVVEEGFKKSRRIEQGIEVPSENFSTDFGFVRERLASADRLFKESLEKGEDSFVAAEKEAIEDIKKEATSALESGQTSGLIAVSLVNKTEGLRNKIAALKEGRLRTKGGPVGEVGTLPGAGKASKKAAAEQSARLKAINELEKMVDEIDNIKPKVKKVQGAPKASKTDQKSLPEDKRKTVNFIPEDIELVKTKFLAEMPAGTPTEPFEVVPSFHEVNGKKFSLQKYDDAYFIVDDNNKVHGFVSFEKPTFSQKEVDTAMLSKELEGSAISFKVGDILDEDGIKTISESLNPSSGALVKRLARNKARKIPKEVRKQRIERLESYIRKTERDLDRFSARTKELAEQEINANKHELAFLKGEADAPAVNKNWGDGFSSAAKEGQPKAKKVKGKKVKEGEVEPAKGKKPQKPKPFKVFKNTTTEDVKKLFPERTVIDAGEDGVAHINLEDMGDFNLKDFMEQFSEAFPRIKADATGPRRPLKKMNEIGEAEAAEILKPLADKTGIKVNKLIENLKDSPLLTSDVEVTRFTHLVDAVGKEVKRLGKKVGSKEVTDIDRGNLLAAMDAFSSMYHFLKKSGAETARALNAHSMQKRGLTMKPWPMRLMVVAG